MLLGTMLRIILRDHTHWIRLDRSVPALTYNDFPWHRVTARCCRIDFHESFWMGMKEAVRLAFGSDTSSYFRSIRLMVQTLTEGRTRYGGRGSSFGSKHLAVHEVPGTHVYSTFAQATERTMRKNAVLLRHTEGKPTLQCR